MDRVPEMVTEGVADTEVLVDTEELRLIDMAAVNDRVEDGTALDDRNTGAGIVGVEDTLGEPLCPDPDDDRDGDAVELGHLDTELHSDPEGV